MKTITRKKMSKVYNSTTGELQNGIVLKIKFIYSTVLNICTILNILSGLGWLSHMGDGEMTGWQTVRIMCLKWWCLPSAAASVSLHNKIPTQHVRQVQIRYVCLIIGCKTTMNQWIMLIFGNYMNRAWP